MPKKKIESLENEIEDLKKVAKLHNDTILILTKSFNERDKLINDVSKLLLQLSKRLLELQEIVDTMTEEFEDDFDEDSKETIRKYRDSDFDIDDILDKMIKLGGFDKLTDEEKNFLKNGENN